MKARKILFIFLAILWSGYMVGFVCIQSAKSTQKDSGKIAMIIAKNNFRNDEFSVPKAIFENAGYKVVTFSSSPGKALGMLGTVVKVDETIDELNPGEYEAVVFVGGSGASEYWRSSRAHKIAKDTLANQKILGAICIAPVILANAGVLKDRKATVWPSEKGKLQKEGAIYTGANVEVSGDIVTADGPRSTEKFAETILDLLK